MTFEEPLINSANLEIKSYKLKIHNFPDEDFDLLITKVECIKYSPIRILLFIGLSIFIIPLILVKFSLRCRIAFLYSKCIPCEASKFVIFTRSGEMEIIIKKTFKKVSNNNNNNKNIDEAYFTYKCYNYKINFEKGIVEPIIMRTNIRFSQIHSEYISSPTMDERKSLHSQFGKCVIETPKKSSFKILIEDVMSPFHFFQLFSIILWCCEVYYYYASIIFIITLISTIIEVLEIKENYERLYKMAYYECEVKFGKEIGKGKFDFEAISSLELVPGDIIEVPDNKKLPCDCILLNGSSIINESMLTGESVPVVKSPIPNTEDKFDIKIHKRHVLFSGTLVLENRPPQGQKLCALVIRTGYLTTQGALIRSILYPKPVKLRYERDSYIFVFIMFVLALIGNLIQWKFSIMSLEDKIMKCLDLITVTIPPALPAALSIGTSFALKRLKNENIFCISPQRINMSGRINVFCLDKTGTLTEDSLTIVGFEPVISEKDELFIQNEIIKYQINEFEKINKNTIYSNMDYPILKCMACCHSLSQVNSNIIGDPLDIEMFKSSGWILQDCGKNENDILIAYVSKPEESNTSIKSEDKPKPKESLSFGIVRRFEFNSDLQRMSVIVQSQQDNKFYVFVKGSPEKIKDLCSKVPLNYDKTLNSLCSNGYRVIALSGRQVNLNYVQSQKVKRDLIETSLQFYGFVIFENKLKPITSSIIQKLHTANVETMMTTGDNPLTAIKVAKDCKIIPENSTIYLGDIIKDRTQKTDQIGWICLDNIGNIESESPKEENKRPKSEEKNNMIENDEEYFVDNFSNSSEKYLDKLSQSWISKSNSRMFSDSFSVFNENEEKANNEIEELEELDEYSCPWKLHPHCFIALTGKAFEQIYSRDSKCTLTLTKELMLRTRVFSRMSPSNKASLVSILQSMGNLVGMCGDGANDCSALRCADVGISLSETEASVAAPFTSKRQDISCIITLLKEGKAALETSLQCFKFMAMYSAIQFSSMTILYSIQSDMSDFQYLFIDLFIIIPLAVTVSWSQSSNTLSKISPPKSLLSLQIAFSLVGHFIFCIGIQILGYYWLIRESWFQPCNPDIEEDYRNCQPNTIIYLISSFLYIIVAFDFSIGKGIRDSIYKNLWLMVNVICVFGFYEFLTLMEPRANKILVYLFNLVSEGKIIPYEFMLKISIGIILFFAFSFAYEYLISCLIFKVTTTKSLKLK